jgi:hypothetical protein
MRDELFVEEMSLRETQEKMDEAFRAAMQRAIDAGEENTPTAVSKKPGTRNPKIVFAFRTWGDRYGGSLNAVSGRHPLNCR